MGRVQPPPHLCSMHFNANGEGLTPSPLVFGGFNPSARWQVFFCPQPPLRLSNARRRVAVAHPPSNARWEGGTRCHHHPSVSHSSDGGPSLPPPSLPRQTRDGGGLCCPPLPLPPPPSHHPPLLPRSNVTKRQQHQPRWRCNKRGGGGHTLYAHFFSFISLYLTSLQTANHHHDDAPTTTMSRW
jgi:hypothetical protein